MPLEACTMADNETEYLLSMGGNDGPILSRL